VTLPADPVNTPELLDVARAVAKAATAIAAAKTAIVEMEIALAAYGCRDGHCGCGCS
jgi:hypothetical protein